MKSVKLTIWERLNLMTCIPDKVNMDTIELAMKVRRKLDLDEEEKEEVGFTLDDFGRAFWNEADRVFELHFEDSEYKLLMAYVKAYQEWPVSELTLNLKRHFIEEAEEYDA